MFKKLVIKWSECGLSCNHIHEEMTIDIKGVSFKRWSDFYLGSELLDELGICNKPIEWKMKINDPEYYFSFQELCDTYINKRDSWLIVSGCDVPMFTIELFYSDGKKKEEEFMLDLLQNGMHEFASKLIKFIPHACTTPLLIDYNSDIDEE